MYIHYIFWNTQNSRVWKKIRDDSPANYRTMLSESCMYVPGTDPHDWQFK